MWKFSNNLHWRDLEGRYPVRPCQDLYSTLCRTGCMRAIYRQLLWHLNVFGKSTLMDLVECGSFLIIGNRIKLRPFEELTWEKYTGLFLLQQAYSSRSSLKRTEDWDRRLRGNCYRLPSLRFQDGNSHFFRAHLSTSPIHSLETQVPWYLSELGQKDNLPRISEVQPDFRPAHQIPRPKQISCIQYFQSNHSNTSQISTGSILGALWSFPTLWHSLAVVSGLSWILKLLGVLPVSACLPETLSRAPPI